MNKETLAALDRLHRNAHDWSTTAGMAQANSDRTFVVNAMMFLTDPTPLDKEWVTQVCGESWIGELWRVGRMTLVYQASGSVGWFLDGWPIATRGDLRAMALAHKFELKGDT